MKNMEGTMRAMVTVAPKKFELQQVPIPKCGPDEVLLKTLYAGVCGSDFPIYNKGLMIPGFPWIQGHEASTVVVEIGKDLVEPLSKQGVKVGSRVVGVTDGLGVRMHGCFAEYFIVNKINVAGAIVPLADNVNDLDGAVLECMMNAGIWYKKPNAQPGMKIVIIGAGIQGLGLVMTLKNKIENIEIAVVDYSPLRLHLAKQMGADHVFNPSVDGDPLDCIIKLWGNVEFRHHRGERVSGNADIVYECSGNTKAWTQAIEMCKIKGKMCSIGIYKEMAEINPLWILFKQVELLGGIDGDPFGPAADMAAGKLPVDKLVTHVFPLEEMEKAFEVAQDPLRAGKVLIKVDQSIPDYPYNKQD